MADGAPAASPELPEWNLADLYPSPDSPDLERDLKAAEERGKAFRAACAGRLAEFDGKALGAAIAEYEQITELLYRAMSYAQLLFAAHITDAKIARFRQT